MARCRAQLAGVLLGASARSIGKLVVTDGLRVRVGMRISVRVGVEVSLRVTVGARGRVKMRVRVGL